MIASIIKTTKLNQVPSITNLGAGGGIELIRWGYIENTLIIITSSIPCIRPLIISSVRKLSSVTRSYELSSPFSGRQTDQYEASESRRARRFHFSGHSQKNHAVDPEDGSVDRILGRSQSVHTSATAVGRESSSPTQENVGITKQVDISVSHQ